MLKLYFAAKNRLDAVKDFFSKKEEGASLAEYGLLIALIAVACIGALTAFGGAVKQKLFDAAVNAGI